VMMRHDVTTPNGWGPSIPRRMPLESSWAQGLAGPRDWYHERLVERKSKPDTMVFPSNIRVSCICSLKSTTD
jgi:hypothetical protein